MFFDESFDFLTKRFQIYDFWRNFRFLIKILDFWCLNFFVKNRFFGEKFDLWPKFRFSRNFTDIWSNFGFFGQKSKFPSKNGIWTKELIIGKFSTNNLTKNYFFWFWISILNSTIGNLRVNWLQNLTLLKLSKKKSSKFARRKFTLLRTGTSAKGQKFESSKTPIRSRWRAPNWTRNWRKRTKNSNLTPFFIGGTKLLYKIWPPKYFFKTTSFISL